MLSASGEGLFFLGFPVKIEENSSAVCTPTLELPSALLPCSCHPAVGGTSPNSVDFWHSSPECCSSSPSPVSGAAYLHFYYFIRI